MSGMSPVSGLLRGMVGQKVSRGFSVSDPRWSAPRVAALLLFSEYKKKKFLIVPVNTFFGIRPLTRIFSREKKGGATSEQAPGPKNY
jgi:hypothetical protein